MHPVVAPSRSSHTRSVLARFLVRFSGNGILTEVTRFMTLRTSSRSAALAGERTVTRRPTRIRDHADCGIGESPEASRIHLGVAWIGQIKATGELSRGSEVSTRGKKSPRAAG